MPHILRMLSTKATLCFNLTSIKSLHKKLWASKMARILIWESREKRHLDVAFMGVIENTMKGKVEASPKFMP